MLAVAVQDYVDTINRDRSIYGQEVDPLEVRKILGETVTLSKWLLGYDVNMNLCDLQLHGLGSISVEDVRVERNSDLSEVRVGVMVSVENLLLSGQYNMSAVPSMTWLLSNISSEGVRDMSISLDNVTIGAEVGVGLGSSCTSGAFVKEILFPLRYGDIDFQFDNIGEVLRAGLDIIGDVLLETERLKMADLVKSLIGSEVQSLVCEEYGDQISHRHELDQDDIPHFDRQFRNLLKREEAVTRDRLAENLAKKIFNESIKKHLLDKGSELRSMMDPLQMFPLEIPIHTHVYKVLVEACNFNLHNGRRAELESVVLVRDPGLAWSAWRIQFHIPIVWMTGNYYLRNGKLFKFIPIKGSGDFMVDLKDVRVSMTIVLRHNQEGDEGDLEIENFDIDAGWRDINIKFDGFLTGVGDLADTLLNKLGVGQLIVERQKAWAVKEIKTYLHGMAVCMMWSPGMGIELCMRKFWIDEGWEYPWKYPDCN